MVVKGLVPDVTELEVDTHFSRMFGAVAKTVVLYDKHELLAGLLRHGKLVTKRHRLLHKLQQITSKVIVKQHTTVAKRVASAHCTHCVWVSGVVWGLPTLCFAQCEQQPEAKQSMLRTIAKLRARLEELDVDVAAHNHEFNKRQVPRGSGLVAACGLYSH